MKIVSIHQPAYLPWLGYFHKIAISDIFVFLDTVQFEKNSYTNRNKILTNNGPIWLTVPVRMQGHSEKKIIDMDISQDKRWKKKHLGSIKQAYSKAPFFSVFFSDLEKFYKNDTNSFSDLIYDMTGYFLNILDIKTEIVRSSDLPVNGIKSDLVKKICKHLHGDIYLSGPFGKEYLNLQDFKKENITIVFQDYRPCQYEQLHKDFQKGMSIIDLLMNLGPERGLRVIMSGNIDKDKLVKVNT